MNNWIKIKDKKPLIGQYVLVCGGNSKTGITLHTEFALYAGIHSQQHTFLMVLPRSLNEELEKNYRVYTHHVTYWQPLPLPPENPDE